MKYPILLFDADDTLFDFKKSAHHSLSKTFVHFDIKAGPSHFETYHAINHEIWTSFERREITAEELRRLRFERFLSAIGEYRDVMEMNRFYLHQLSQTDILLDGARQLIESLQGNGHRLGLITNGLREVQRPRIIKAGMDKHFEAIIVSDEIGVSKPHLEFFEHAFGKMGHPVKGHVLVVGDSLSSDIQGGNNFGVATCWFNPSKDLNRSQHQPSFEISELENLLEIVG